MTVRWRVWLAVAACALVGVAVGGCGDSSGGSAAGGVTATPVPTTPVTGSSPASRLPTGTPTAVPTSGSPVPEPTGSGIPLPRPDGVVVRGVIEAGVEAGCWVLTPDRAGPRYVLVTATTPPTGVPVTVYGTPHPDQVSYCQQGTVLAVNKIERR